MHRVIIVSLVGAVSVRVVMDSRWFRLIADRNDGGGGGGALMDVLNRISSRRRVNIVVSSSQCQWSGIDMRAARVPISCSRSYVTTAAACHAVVVVGLPN